MTPPRLRAIGLGLLTVAAIGLGIGLFAPGASAADRHVQIAVRGTAFTPEPTMPLLDLSGLIPGGSTSGTMAVRNGFDSPSRLSVRMTGVAGADNGCMGGEKAADPGCSAGAGQLGSEVRFTLGVATSAAGPFTTLWTGTAAQLAAQTQLVDADLAAGATSWVQLSGALPFSAGNEVETDSLGFDLEVVLSSASGTAGVTVHGGGTSPPGSTSGTGGLAVTGIQLAGLVGAGALALGGGAVLLVASRRRSSVGTVRRPAAGPAGS